MSWLKENWKLIGAAGLVVAIVSILIFSAVTGEHSEKPRTIQERMEKINFTGF